MIPCGLPDGAKLDCGIASVVCLFGGTDIVLSDADWTTLTGQNEAETRRRDRRQALHRNSVPASLQIRALGTRLEYCLRRENQSSRTPKRSSFHLWETGARLAICMCPVPMLGLPKTSFPSCASPSLLCFSETKSVLERNEFLKGLLKSVTEFWVRCVTSFTVSIGLRNSRLRKACGLTGSRAGVLFKPRP